MNADVTFVHALARRLDEASLQAVAESDYGWQAEHARRQLERIRMGDARAVLTEADFTLREVLELTRWQRAEAPEQHLQRLFACSCLIAANGFGCPLTATMAIAVDSAIALGSTIRDEFHAFLHTVGFEASEEATAEKRLPLLAHAALAAARHDAPAVREAVLHLIGDGEWAVVLMGDHKASLWIELLAGLAAWSDAPAELPALTQVLVEARRFSKERVARLRRFPRPFP